MDFSQACVVQLRENVDSEYIRNTKSSVILQQFFLHVKCYKHAKRNLFYQIVIWVLAEHLLMLTKNEVYSQRRQYKYKNAIYAAYNIK